MLLEERKVCYLSNLYWRDATLAASLLRNRGNCLSTSTLYMLAGEALNLPIHMVLVPRHAFEQDQRDAFRELARTRTEWYEWRMSPLVLQSVSSALPAPGLIHMDRGCASLSMVTTTPFAPA